MMDFFVDEAATLHLLSIDNAARMIAKKGIPADDEEQLEAVCNRFGLSLDSLTDDECDIMSNLIENYAN